MGYLFAAGNCVVCRKLFTFNPELVPSYEGKPICKTCIERANAILKAHGEALIRVLPGAYDESKVV